MKTDASARLAPDGMAAAEGFRSILCPTDLSPAAAHATSHAVALAAALGGRVTLYHAVEMLDHRYPHWNFEESAASWRQAEREATRALEQYALAHSGVQVAVERVSSVPLAIVEMVMRQRPDLLVVGTRGRSGLRHLFLGSVAEDIVRAVNVPTICVREPAVVPYRRILVTTDFSPASARAFPVAGRLAELFGAAILAVHVAPPQATAAALGFPVPAPVTEASLWSFLKPSFPDTAVTPHVHTGRVAERIVQVAEVEGADLIVMSTRGHDSLSDSIVGSTTERVLRHAACPVLVV
ncbi:MAG TPA: universal stress protein [Vicinamibacteria bacterium]|nr:universal stress protein [Vicinamibacteria bacterium]